MIKYFSFALLISSSLFAMEVTQEQIDFFKPALIQSKTDELMKKLNSQKRTLRWCEYATLSTLFASLAAKLGYIPSDKIGARGYLIMAGGCAFFTFGGIMSVGKLENELKKVPELIDDEYVKNHIKNCRRKPKV